MFVIQQLYFDVFRLINEFFYEYCIIVKGIVCFLLGFLKGIGEVFFFVYYVYVLAIVFGCCFQYYWEFDFFGFFQCDFGIVQWFLIVFDKRDILLLGQFFGSYFVVQLFYVFW